MAFDISKFAETLKVSDSDTAVDQITYIPLDDLIADGRNFYEISGIQDLASNIQLCGLQQPIRVREAEGGRYRIVSGHRRCAALRSLVEQGDPKFAKVPCIIEHGESSPAMQELRLIFANSSTRQLTPAEQMKQTSRVEALLYQLKEEGVDFPGRMRDQVAAACKVTGTKLAELKVIREKLQEPFMGQFTRDELTVSAAYKLARLPKDIQKDVAEAVGDRYRINYVSAENLGKYAESYYTWAADQTCDQSGSCCDNVLGMLKRTAKSNYIWQYCPGKCCLLCNDRHSCAGACKYAKQRKAAEKAAEEKKEAAAKKRREHDAAERRKANIKNAQRLVRAIDRTDLGGDDKLALFCCGFDRTVKSLRSIAAGDTGSMNFYNDNIFLPNTQDLPALADQLQCSVDYLLGRTEELDPQPDPGAQPWQPLDEEHWPNVGSSVILRGKTVLDGRIYVAVRCRGTCKDPLPFEDALDHVPLHPCELDELAEWMPLDGRKGEEENHGKA